MRAKWTEFIQEGVEMLGMKPKLLTRMGWFPVFFFFVFVLFSWWKCRKFNKYCIQFGFIDVCIDPLIDSIRECISVSVIYIYIQSIESNYKSRQLVISFKKIKQDASDI